MKIVIFLFYLSADGGDPGSAGAGAGPGEATGGGEAERGVSAAWDLSGESTLRNVNEYLYSSRKPILHALERGGGDVQLLGDQVIQ